MDHYFDSHSVLLLRERLERKRLRQWLRLQQRLRRLLLTRHDIRRRNQKYPLSAARRSGVLLCPAQTHYKEPAQSEHFPDRTWFRRRPCGRAHRVVLEAEDAGVVAGLGVLEHDPVAVVGLAAHHRQTVEAVQG